MPFRHVGRMKKHLPAFGEGQVSSVEEVKVMECMRRVSFLALLIAILPASGQCQVVISGGVTETYDDNIFLESGDGVPPPIIFDSELETPETTLQLPETVDGKKDSDFLTDVQFTASGAPNLLRGLKSTLSGTVGAIFFADHGDQDRLTLNTDLNFQTTNELIPDPFFVAVSSSIRSQANDASVAQGTASRLTQTHYAALELGARNVQLMRDLNWGAGYRLGYSDFLGDFTFSDNDDDLGALQNRFRNQGSDYLTNTVSTNFQDQFTKRLRGTLSFAFNHITFTKVETNDVVTTEEDQLDRTEFVPTAQLEYQVSDKVSVDGAAGYNFATFQEEQTPRTVTITNADGTQSTVLQARDKNQDSLIFSGGLTYAPTTATNFRVGANQYATVDIDGNRLVTRSVSLTGVHTLTDELRANASGRFLQYNISQDLDNPIDRYEFTLGLQYSITPSVALNGGWSYSTQIVDEGDLSQRVLLTAEDYTDNRFFIGLNAGFVGLLN